MQGDRSGGYSGFCPHGLRCQHVTAQPNASAAGRARSCVYWRGISALRVENWAGGCVNPRGSAPPPLLPQRQALRHPRPCGRPSGDAGLTGRRPRERSAPTAVTAATAPARALAPPAPDRTAPPADPHHHHPAAVILPRSALPFSPPAAPSRSPLRLPRRPSARGEALGPRRPPSFPATALTGSRDYFSPPPGAAQEAAGRRQRVAQAEAAMAALRLR